MFAESDASMGARAFKSLTIEALSVYTVVYSLVRATSGTRAEAELINPSWDSNTQRPHTDGITIKTDTVRDDDTSDNYYGELCAFGEARGMRTYHMTYYTF